MVPLSASTLASERVFSAGSLLSSGTGSKYVIFGEWLHIDLVIRLKDTMIEEGIFPEEGSSSLDWTNPTKRILEVWCLKLSFSKRQYD